MPIVHAEGITRDNLKCASALAGAVTGRTRPGTSLVSRSFEDLIAV